MIISHLLCEVIKIIINRIDFKNFRSFGPNNTSIEFDKNITFFVGKNHTGKSNLLKLLKEMKIHKFPSNSNYIFSKANWFNNEIGVDKPLKISFTIDINQNLYQFICEEWFLQPIKQVFNNYIKKGDNFKEEKKISNEFDFALNKILLQKYFPLEKAILSIELIRFSDFKQAINYNVRFNNTIFVCTADGRLFIQNLNKKKDKQKWEKKKWKEYIKQIIIESNSTKIVQIPNLIEYFITSFNNSFDKFIFHNKAIDEIFNILFKKIEIGNGYKILECNDKKKKKKSEISNVNYNLAKKLELQLQEGSIDLEKFKKYTYLHNNFQDMFEDLDIAFGMDQDSNGIYIKYYNMSTNNIVYNFDSIGTGITEMLYFLYILIIESNKILIIDSPEHQLHPHSQRHLSNLMKEYSVKNNHQIIIISHSPYFFQPDDLFNLRLFELSNKITRIRQVDIPNIQRDIYRLKRSFSIRNRSAIFADGLIFVEGPSEDMSFPYFFRSYGLDLDQHNLSLINLNGKGSFSVYLKFAKQLHKKYWFFFDNDVLGVKAGQIITSKVFKRSIIYKNRNLFSKEIIELCENMINMENDSTIYFQEQLELLRNQLQEYHIFIIMDDFEGIFEEFLIGRVQFSGSKVEKSMQLVEFLQDHEGEQLLPERLFPFIKLIKEELKKDYYQF